MESQPASIAASHRAGRASRGVAVCRRSALVAILALAPGCSLDERRVNRLASDEEQPTGAPTTDASTVTEPEPIPSSPESIASAPLGPTTPSDGGAQAAGEPSPSGPSDSPRPGLPCAPGFHPCVDRCEPDAATATCGTACLPCPEPDNGDAACISGSCAVRCDVGFHDCSGQCVRSDAAESCGEQCAPCPAPTGGGARCEGGICVPTCPEGQVLCGASCLPVDAACDGSCPPSTHICADFCSPDDSATSCGDSCSPCPTTDDGRAVCENGTCAIVCNESFHECGGACVSNYDVNACGDRCEPCPSGPVNSLPSCNVTSEGAICEFACIEGYHRCGNECVPSDSTESCGSRCEPCAAPVNGTATCDGLECGIACDDTFQACTTECCSPSQVCFAGALCRAR